MSTIHLSRPRRREPAAPTPEGQLPGLGLAAILLAYSLPVLSFFTVTVAFGTMQRDLHASEATLQLVVATFGVAYASLVVLGGRLGDGHGRRRMIGLGLSLLLLASILCAVATSPVVLIAGRAAQGAGAAMLAPQVLATIQSGTSGETRARAMGLFGAMAGIATCVAFLLGGALVSADPAGLGWRSVFLLNVPIGLAALMALRWVPESRSTDHSHLDVTGTVLLAATVVLLVLPLTEGRAAGWPLWTWVLLVAVVPALAALLTWERRVERRGRAALLPPSVLRGRAISVGLATMLGFFTVFGGFMFVFALVAQTVAGMSPIGLGLTLGPFAGTFLLASLLSAPIAARTPVRLMQAGALTAAVGFVALVPPLASGWPHFTALQIALPLMVIGLGQAWLVVPLFGTVIAGVPAEHVGVGSGLLITALQMGLGLGSAIVGTAYLGLSAGSTGPGAAVVVLLVIAAVVALLAPLIGRLRHSVG